MIQYPFTADSFNANSLSADIVNIDTFNADSFSFNADTVNKKLIIYIKGRNNSNISGSQQDNSVEKSGSPQIYLVVTWCRFKQNMTNKKFEIFTNCMVVHRTTAVIIFGSPTKFLVVLGLPDYHYFDPCTCVYKPMHTTCLAINITAAM